MISLNRFTLSSILCCLLFIMSCQQSSTSKEEGGNSLLKAEEFMAMMQKSDGAQLVDVRTTEEFGAGHLNGAQNIDFLSSKFPEMIKTLDANKPVLVYCASGKRSEKAAEALRQSGFKQVYELEGGIKSWIDAKLPTE